MREFETGATRDSDENKWDFEGFLSPHVLEAYAAYMHKNRLQADGKLRDSDNWQKGIPIDAYMKSMWRHFFAVWKGHRTGTLQDEELCALLFNVMGMLHERIKARATAPGGCFDWSSLEPMRSFQPSPKIAPGGALPKRGEQLEFPFDTPSYGAKAFDVNDFKAIHGYVPNLKASDGE